MYSILLICGIKFGVGPYHYAYCECVCMSMCITQLKCGKWWQGVEGLLFMNNKLQYMRQRKGIIARYIIVQIYIYILFLFFIIYLFIIIYIFLIYLFILIIVNINIECSLITEVKLFPEFNGVLILAHCMV